MWEMWFRDGQGRELIISKDSLLAMAARFDFNADEVLRTGETEFIAEDGEIVGGVFESPDNGRQ
jgi:hypothetical protein